jgi:diacylglycerol kinase family enzyme
MDDARIASLAHDRPCVDDAALAAAEGAPLIVAVGGDGSVREAADAIAHGEAPLAIVPAGTGNVLAGSLGIRGIGPALEAIRSGRTRRLDLGRARWGPAVGMPGPGTDQGPAERIFIVACGMGLDARIMAAAESEWKRRLRFGAYVGAAIRALRPFAVDVSSGVEITGPDGQPVKGCKDAAKVAAFIREVRDADA